MLADDLSCLLGLPVEVTDQRSLGGGCISDVAVVTVRCEDREAWKRLTQNDQAAAETQLVIKRNSAEMVGNFRCEAEGLQAIAGAGVIRVPAVYAVDVVGGQAWLAMESIAVGSARSAGGGYREFGRQLARFHRATSGTEIGWHQDNFLGSAHQPNSVCPTWPEFVAVRRIGFQIRWAADQGLVDSKLKSDCETIVARMQDLLSGRDEVTSLLHGDLWSGNYLFDTDGQPVLIDPAVSYGCREAEWGMIKLFGGCPPEFEAAYLDQWPLAAGWRRRVLIYLLYHQLNHLNLFGSSYLGGCRSTAAEVLRR